MGSYYLGMSPVKKIICMCRHLHFLGITTILIWKKVVLKLDLVGLTFYYQIFL